MTDNAVIPGADELTRADVDRLQGLVVLEFGAQWCGYCIGTHPHVAELLKEHRDVRHIRIEDGRGKPLGRSFWVKLWPTFVFLRDGHVTAQLVRPDPVELCAAFHALAHESGS